jgi:hypothetical protein
MGVSSNRYIFSLFFASLERFTPLMTRLASFAGTARKLVGDNSPAILTAAAVVGVVATAVLVAKAAPQAHNDIANEQFERADEVTAVEKVRLTYQYFIPAVAVGTATVACIIGANTISTKRSTALASAVGLSEYAFKEYRNKVIEHIGTNKETKVHDDVMKDVVDRTPVDNNAIILTGERSLFMDSFARQYTETDMETVRRAVNDINEQIYNDMYASLNDFYNLIGIPASNVGEEVGWTTEHKLNVRYSTQLVKGRPCVVIDYDKTPIRDYHKFG